MYSLINLRILVKVLITLTSIISLACRPDQKFNIADKADLAITNVTLIDGTGSEAQQNANIYIKDGRIVEIDAFEPVFKKSVEPMLRHHMGFESFQIEERKPIMENFRLLHEKGVTNVVGTDVGALAYIQPGHSLHEELQLLQLRGMSPLDIIKCATLNGAKMLEVDADYGSLEEGKVADMILLDKNPLEDITNTLTINTVFKRGKVQPRIEKK